MTEDELFFAVDAIRTDLRRANDRLRTSTSFLETCKKTLERNGQVRKSVNEALGHLFSSPVVSIGEYRSLKNGLDESKKQLADILEKHAHFTKIRNQAALDIPKLEAQLVDLERQLEQFESPSMILEFKRNDKQ